ncbi:glycosyltransferase [Thermanaerovibrio velox DSM 12556]|uniref:Glycosyltransferase n=1 Tax=Thermanaerovibrio velox DSM 12556 TaxID=926567 RepID=H0UN26_9BACT|nr:glycosyltransferase family 4 protein [Thermanaerovibrio velox]EHM09305.1 glycosyltransferase [Thermanaerovibrio velox DSM 12556]
MRLKVLQILPEFQEGGVERHVLNLSNALHTMGHSVTVVSAGGALQHLLDGPSHISMEVHRKNPVTGFLCALRLAREAREGGFHIIHAHSRVPAWIAWWASEMSRIPWMATCHSFYSRNLGLIPYSRAGRLICVSAAVRDFFDSVAPGVPKDVIYNGLPKSPFSWTGSGEDVKQMVFVGRLTPIKGLQVLLAALDRVRDLPWFLHVLGDGPKMGEYRALVEELCLTDRVRFWGFVKEPEEIMARCDCLVFPSLSEGMGLVLMRAVSMGMPVLASDIPAVRELAQDIPHLVPPGDADAWGKALQEFLLRQRASALLPSRIPSMERMAAEVEESYTRLIRGRCR